MLGTVNQVLSFIRDAKNRNLLITTICHGPQLLISTNVFPPGTMATGVADIRDDMTNDGFAVQDKPVVNDKD
jgi:protease I